MSASRLSKPDTAADTAIQSHLDEMTSFVVVAGAGSGKTTSLVKALAYVESTRGVGMRRKKQRVACITYTEVAREEIEESVADEVFFHVSTIHSFFWSIVSAFPNDIRAWVKLRIREKIEELEEKIAKPRTRETTREAAREKIGLLSAQENEMDRVDSFRYGTGSDYANGVLGHDDIIKMGPAFIAHKPLFRSIVAQSFPFIFVDESQDTLAEVVEALQKIQSERPADVCLGFFGDPMQMIYTTGIGEIPLGDGWKKVDKPENFRSPLKVLEVINNIRNGVDSLIQQPGRGDGTPPGSAHCFICSSQEDRNASLHAVRKLLAETHSDENWLKEVGEDVRVFVIVHRMAANRLGFGELFSAFNDSGPPQRFKDGFREGAHWALNPFLRTLLPLAQAQRDGKSYEVMSILREYSPRFQVRNISKEDLATMLAEVSNATKKLSKIFFGADEFKVSDLVRLAKQERLLEFDERWNLNLEQEEVWVSLEGESDNAMQDFMTCPAKQLIGYQTYIEQESLYDTQHGIKGAEFERVITILDDEEGSHRQYSYDKFFGLAPLSATDRRNIEEGRDSVVDRTKRLFYVSCSRATAHLAVVYFTDRPDEAFEKVTALGVFSEENVEIVSIN